MNVVRFNQRNCGGTDALAPVIYHSGLSSDIAAVARELIRKDGVSKFALIGFSMGGNLVLKLAGEWGADPPPQCRAVFVAYHLGGMSKDEITEGLGMKRRMVDRHLHKALVICLERLEGFDA